MSKKPNRLIDEFQKENEGLSINIETKALENDVWANLTLRDIGKSMCLTSHKYLGSVATHIYVTESGNIMKEITYKHQTTDISEIAQKVMSLAIADLAKLLKSKYDGKEKRFLGARNK